MKAARMLGIYVEELAKINQISVDQLSKALNCTEHRIQMFFKGRAFLSFPQMIILSNLLNVLVGDLLSGDEEIYRANVINCNQEFDNDDNRERILDIIDDYMDLYDVVMLSREEEE